MCKHCEVHIVRSYCIFKRLDWITCEGHDKDTDGDDPRHSAVGFIKVCHEVLKEDPKNLDDAVGENLHEEEGSSHQPTPASIGHLLVHIGARAALQDRHYSCHDAHWRFCKCKQSYSKDRFRYDVISTLALMVCPCQLNSGLCLQAAHVFNRLYLLDYFTFQGAKTQFA